MQISSCRLGNSCVLGLLLGNVETAVKLDIKFWFVDVGLSTSDSIWACLFLFFFFFFDTVIFFYHFFVFCFAFFFLMKNVYLGLLNITIQETDLGKTWRVFQGRESQGLMRA